MLVLRRKSGETVMLGDSIEVHVLAVEGDTVKLGFVAPRSVQILRKEVYEALMQENRQAGIEAAGTGKPVLDLLKTYRDVKVDAPSEEDSS
ncbi:MAG: carbon storage regulator [Paenibacillaceae bacterium ZCTH02-B3]|nr:MAG: carbon storage regulator [Paenibacillaceae bacterium ZCTH02-B3]